MPPAAPPSLATIAARVDARLDELLDGRARRAGSASTPISAGRSTRSAAWSAPAASGCGRRSATGASSAPAATPTTERVVDAGAAFELMHAFALFHDDVMDDSASRRGAPTTHAVYADEHGRATWAGESRRFGEGVAILVGDLAFVLADQLLIGAPTEAWALWNELRIELNVGQYLDILGSVQRERRLVKAERIARYKSGKYTIERPLHLGAVLAAPDAGRRAARRRSARYGLPLGDAFQMRDDVIGAFGDAAVTGKPVGDDLREGKPTPLLARAVAARRRRPARRCSTASARRTSTTTRSPRSRR